MRILVTGATGFIGSAFVRAAMAAGHSIGALTRGTACLPSGVKEFRGTLADSPMEEIAAFSPDLCVHSAWVTTPGVYLQSSENEQFFNSSLSFLEQLTRIGVRRAFVLGTCVEYAADAPMPLLEETSRLRPETPYAQCKHRLREALNHDPRFSKLEVAWGRVFYPFGPGEHLNRLPRSIITRLKNGEPILLRSPAAVKDYIFIDDLAEAMLRVAESSYAGPINLGTGDGISVVDFAREIARQLGKVELIRPANPPEADPLGDKVAEVSRLKGLGWQKRTTLEEGLAKLIAAH